MKKSHKVLAMILALALVLSTAVTAFAKEEIPSNEVRLPVVKVRPAPETPAEEVPAAEEIPAEGEELPAEGEELPAEEVIPAEGEEIPAEGEELPAEGEEIPAEEVIPAEGEELPAEGEVPAEGEELPAEGEVPAEEEVPAEGEELPAEEVVPAEGEELPAEGEELPAEEEIPAEPKKEIDYSRLKVSFTSNHDKADVEEGTVITLTAHVEGFEEQGIEYVVYWEHSENGTTFTRAGSGMTYSFAAEPENEGWLWRATVEFDD